MFTEGPKNGSIVSPESEDEEEYLIFCILLKHIYKLVAYIDTQCMHLSVQLKYHSYSMSKNAHIPLKYIF